MSTMTEPLPEGHPNRWLRGDLPPGSTGSVTLELGGIAEIAEEFGVNRQTASMWGTRRASSQFPEPVAVLASGPIYDMAAVRRWHAARKPRKVAAR